MILSGIISGEARADDQPRLLNGLVSNTVADVTDVLDEVLPQPEKQPKDKSKGEDDGTGKKDKDKKQRDTPIRDAVEKVKDKVEDGVENTAGKVEDVVTPPARTDEPTSVEAADPQTDTATEHTDPVADVELPDLADPTDVPDPPQQTPTLNIGETHPHVVPAPGDYTCGHAWHQRRTGDHRRRLVRIAVLRDADLVASGYTTPTPSTPTGPDQDVTLTIASPSSPFTGLQQDATLTARATMPRTTAVRIPGRNQAVDSRIRRPDPPSG